MISDPDNERLKWIVYLYLDALSVTWSYIMIASILTERTVITHFLQQIQQLGYTDL